MRPFCLRDAYAVFLREYKGMSIKDIDDLEIERFLMLLPDPRQWSKGQGRKVKTLQEALEAAGLET